jgi:hypothetical protein
VQAVLRGGGIDVGRDIWSRLVKLQAPKMRLEASRILIAVSGNPGVNSHQKERREIDSGKRPEAAGTEELSMMQRSRQKNGHQES